jgi:type I restriction enzyme R subunit
LPSNLAYNDGAGNPPTPAGIKTDYLWKQILTKAGLTDIVENYAQIVKNEDPRTARKRPVQIFPHCGKIVSAYVKMPKPTQVVP